LPVLVVGFSFMVRGSGLASMTRTGETGCVGALIRIPLRVLPCLAVSLVASGAVAIGIAGVSGAGSYLIRQADNDLLACASSMLSHGMVAAPGSGPVSRQMSPGACSAEYAASPDHPASQHAE
jgi:hypothetical protein